MTTTEAIISIAVMAIATITLLTVGTLAAAGLMGRSSRDRTPEPARVPTDRRGERREAA